MTFLQVLGNIVWLVFGGLLSALGWFLAGCVCCITIIGFPIGLQCFKFSRMLLCPFGKTVYFGNMSSGSVLLNVIWILLCGIELAAASALMGAACCVTVIGIPFGIQHFKFAALALLPFGAEIKEG